MCVSSKISSIKLRASHPWYCPRKFYWKRGISNRKFSLNHQLLEWKTTTTTTTKDQVCFCSLGNVHWAWKKWVVIKMLRWNWPGITIQTIDFIWTPKRKKMRISWWNTSQRFMHLRGSTNVKFGVWINATVVIPGWARREEQQAEAKPIQIQLNLKLP